MHLAKDIRTKLTGFGLRLLLTLFLSVSALAVQAQCAMCRSTLENNVSDNTDIALAAKLNTGIIYLFIMPYLIIAVVAYLWYRQSKKKAYV